MTANTQSVKSAFEDIVKRVPKVLAVLASDKEGLILCKAVSDTFKEKGLDTTLSSTLFSSTEQASKLQMGTSRCTVTVYNNVLVLHSILSSPSASVGAGSGAGQRSGGQTGPPAAGMLLSIVCSMDANIGDVINVISDLKLKVDPLRELKFKY